MWTDYVIDATMGKPFCFCPLDGDNIVTGMNIIGYVPKGGKIVGVVHEDGREAAQKFYDENKEEIDKLISGDEK